MKKYIILICLLFVCHLLSAEESLKGQVLPINEKANEEIIIINNSPRKEAFKIYTHTKNGSALHFNYFGVNYTSTEEGWNFVLRTPDVKCNEKWKSSSDYEILELSDYICIESKSGIKYNYTFETKHDKLYITVSNYKEGDDW